MKGIIAALLFVCAVACDQRPVSGDIPGKIVEEETSKAPEPSPALKNLVPGPFAERATFINGQKMKMIWVEPGSFRMGTDDPQAPDLGVLPFEEKIQVEREYRQRLADVRRNEQPARTVQLSGFHLSATEVTQEQYYELTNKTPSHFGPGAALPVENVNWNEAIEFCRRLTARERELGSLPEGYEYTLPTEAQWEYACRAGADEGDIEDPGAMAWYGTHETCPVSAKQSNAWGFHDMSGNVWEWCLDFYGDYDVNDTRDPRGPRLGSNRVIRGGSWNFGVESCRSAYRSGIYPASRSSDQGFRVALCPVR